MVNVTENEAQEALTSEEEKYPGWNTTPSSSQARLPCSIADLAHTTNITMSTPLQLERRENATPAVVRTKAWNTFTKQRQTPRKTVPVSLFTLQATWLMGHSVVTDRGARGSHCICVVNCTYNILIRKNERFYCILKYSQQVH